MNNGVFGEKIRRWLGPRVWGLALFNVILMLLVLLKSAGYFDPFFPLTINVIIFLSMILLIFFLDFRSKTLFLIAIFFLLLSAIFRVLNINIWAERASIYMFQAIVLAVAVIFVETLISRLHKYRR